MSRVHSRRLYPADLTVVAAICAAACESNELLTQASPNVDDELVELERLGFSEDQAEVYLAEAFNDHASGEVVIEIRPMEEQISRLDSPEQRAIIRLVIAGLEIGEIAEIMALDADTTLQLAERAVINLRRLDAPLIH